MSLNRETPAPVVSKDVALPAQSLEYKSVAEEQYLTELMAYCLKHGISFAVEYDAAKPYEAHINIKGENLDFSVLGNTQEFFDAVRTEASAKRKAEAVQTFKTLGHAFSTALHSHTVIGEKTYPTDDDEE